jgi:hypothetical protein
MRMLKEKTALTAKNLQLTAKALENVTTVSELDDIVNTLETCLVFTKMILYSCKKHLRDRAAHDYDPKESDNIIS